MKSPQTLHLRDAAKYSELQVMQSRAGWYVGTEYEDGSPGTRDSHGYYATEREARRARVLMRLGKMEMRLEP